LHKEEQIALTEIALQAT